MNSLQIPGDGLVDEFIADNMLTEEDLDFNPDYWDIYDSNESYESSSKQSYVSGHNDLANDHNDKFTRMTPPDTPPSSDRSTPPSSDRSTPPDFSNLSIFNTCPSSNELDLSPIDNKLDINNLNFVTILPQPSIISPANTQISPANTQLSQPILFPNNISSVIQVQPQERINQINNSINNDITNNINNNITNRKIIPKGSFEKVQMSQLKKEARKVRNRQASIASRKRKQEYLEHLTAQVDNLKKENADLRFENQQLRNRLSIIEKENQSLKRLTYQQQHHQHQQQQQHGRNNFIRQINDNKKTTFSLLAVIFMLGLNLAPYSGILSAVDNINNNNINGVGDRLPRQNTNKHGRSLLWVSDNKSEYNSSKQIEQLFANFSTLLSTKKSSTNRSVEDQCVYEYAKSAVNCLLQGDALNKSNLLACVVEQTFARNTSENNNRVQRRHVFRLSQSFFASNRAAIRGLQGMFFNKNYLTKKIDNTEISSFTSPDSQEYQLLVERFRYLFCWPDFMLSLDDENHNSYDYSKRNLFTTNSKLLSKSDSRLSQSLNSTKTYTSRGSKKKLFGNNSQMNLSPDRVRDNYRNSTLNI